MVPSKVFHYQDKGHNCKLQYQCIAFTIGGCNICCAGNKFVTERNTSKLFAQKFVCWDAVQSFEISCTEFVYWNCLKRFVFWNSLYILIFWNCLQKKIYTQVGWFISSLYVSFCYVGSSICQQMIVMSCTVIAFMRVSKSIDDMNKFVQFQLDLKALCMLLSTAQRKLNSKWENFVFCFTVFSYAVLKCLNNPHTKIQHILCLFLLCD